jgi:hypothetical protein
MAAKSSSVGGAFSSVGEVLEDFVTLHFRGLVTLNLELVVGGDRERLLRGRVLMTAFSSSCVLRGVNLLLGEKVPDWIRVDAVIALLVEFLGRRVSCFVDGADMGLTLAFDRVTVDVETIFHAPEYVFLKIEVQIG